MVAYRLRGSRTSEKTVERSVTIERAPDELYALWRDVRQAPRFVERVHAVEPLDERRSRWVGKTPGGAAAEWLTELTDDRPGELLGWRAEQPGVSGRVEFAAGPPGRGTQVRLSLEGSVAAPLLERLAAEDLRRFKRLAETGEIATVRGQPAGRRSLRGRALVGRRERPTR